MILNKLKADLWTITILDYFHIPHPNFRNKVFFLFRLIVWSAQGDILRNNVAP